MGVLQQKLDGFYKELCTVDSLRPLLIRNVLKAKGLELSEEQIETLSKVISSSIEDRVEVELDGVTENIVVTDEDLEVGVESLEEDIAGHNERVIFTALDELPPGILTDLYADLPEALRHRRGNESRFRDRLVNRWKEGLDRLEMLIMIAQESGEAHLEDIRQRISKEQVIAEEDSDLAVDANMVHALIALHTRACRIASEVLCLLQGGFADGANARWRSLHEVAVTALFLTQHSGDIAERYIDHSVVERLRSAEQYQVHCDVLGYEPFSSEEMDEMRGSANAMIQRYGPAFARDYGWAAQALGITDPTFTKIEASLEMSHWRPFFRLACKSVHASSQALGCCMSLPERFQGSLLAGASNAGLTEPGKLTAHSLTMASVALLTFHPTLDSLIICTCMRTICDDIVKALEAAEAQLEKEMDSSPEDL